MRQFALRIRPLADLYVVVSILSALFVAGLFFAYALRPDRDMSEVLFNAAVPLARAAVQIVLALLIRAAAYLFADLRDGFAARP